MTLFDEVQRSGVGIDILVNNAGYGKFGEFAEVAVEDSLGQIQLNITALTHLTKLFLGSMLQRGSGKIMNVASTAGFQPGPLMAVYYATKAYVISFSEALANELGAAIGRRGWQLVYGGGRAGLMGVLADAALAAGARVVGVIPQSLLRAEVGHTALSELHVVQTMHQRKTLMAERADAFVAMPGGIGTSGTIG